MINKVVIIEDEQLNAERIKRILATLRPNSFVVAVLDSIADTIHWFENNDLPDLVLMDIRLVDGISFDVFDKVSIECPIIFTTAFNEYAVQAFKYYTVDYLLKPIEESELATTLQRVEEFTSILEQKHSIDNLLNYIKPKEFRERFLIPYRDGYKTVFVNEILSIYMDTKNVKAYLKNDTEILLHQSLEEIEQQLDPRFFFRANRQFIIHINAIDQVLNYFNGRLKLILKNNVELLVSKERSKFLKDWMDS